jgi:hypothetical protein
VARARDSNGSKALSNITPRSTPDPIGEIIWNYLEPSTSIRYPAVKDEPSTRPTSRHSERRPHLPSGTAPHISHRAPYTTP